MVWIESPTNPLMKVVDIEAISKMVHSVRKDVSIRIAISTLLLINCPNY